MCPAPLLQLSTLLTALSVLLSVSASTAAAAEPFRFALLGDPQIGFGPGGELRDQGRFEQVVEAVNQSQAQLVVVAGDLVQDRTYWQRWLFSRVNSTLRPKTLLVAGNHDVVDLDSLLSYREDHGPDYYEYVHGDVAFVVLDSETARDRSLSMREHYKQWEFIESTLSGHASNGQKHVVLAMHRPPFVDDEAEAESGANWPPESRARLMTLARQARVRWILAGHLHRRHELTTPDGITVVVAPGSARSYDMSPIGYRSFEVNEAGITSQWLTVAPAPSPPWHVPGFREWTPRLFDFSIRHWLLTLLFAAGGVASLRASRRAQGRGAGEPRAWRGVAAALLFYAANMQLDLDEFTQEAARLSAKLSGFYAARHVVTGGLLLLCIAVATFWLARNFKSAHRDRGLVLAMAALAAPSLWFALSVISHHDLGMVFSDDTWDLLTLASVGTILACALSVTGVHPKKLGPVKRAP
jgi:predicted phosphodiesterase